MPATKCPDCWQLTCLKHRQEHHCVPRSKQSSNVAPSSKVAALSKLKQWTTIQNAEKSAMSKTFQLFKSSKSISAAARAKAMASLKQNARGDAQIPLNNRIYLYVESVDGPSKTSKSPGKAEMFFGRDWVVGRLLDKAAQRMQISNLNSMKNDDKERLRLFHVEGGKILEFSDKVINAGVNDGDTLVVIRGVQIPSLLHD